jgi:sugar phosphate isomerase/epimerase
MHPRLTILSRVFERGSLEQSLEGFVRGGAERVGLSPRELTENGTEAGVAAVERSSLDVTHIGHGPMIPIGVPEQRDAAGDAVSRSIDLAVATGARCVYGPAGGAPQLEWEAAALAFAAAIEPAARHAGERGVALLIEPTISLFADISMLHTLRDTVDLAEQSGVGVCIDLQHCWTERGLRESIRRCAANTGLVQLSDWVPGNRHHFRAVPGDGAIPFDRVVGWILEDGYAGLFDLEVYPEPGVAEADTIARAIDRGGSLLDRLGV